MGWRPPLPPVTIAEKADSSLLRAFSSLLLLNALQARPPGLKEPALGGVAGYSVTGRPGNGFLLAIGDYGSLYFPLVDYYRKTPKVKEKLLMGFLEI